MEHHAHSLPGNRNTDHWELISEYEQRVAERCAAFLARVAPELAPWGDLLGRGHDIGKYSDAFQAYLRQAGSADEDIHRSDLSGKVDHSTATAKLAVQCEPRYGAVLAYIFTGHHAGLPDWDVDSGQAGLKQRLNKTIQPWKCDSSRAISELAVPPLPKFANIQPGETIDRRVIGSFVTAQ